MCSGANRRLQLVGDTVCSMHSGIDFVLRVTLNKDDVEKNH